jgi:hypothetical protein
VPFDSLEENSTILLSNAVKGLVPVAFLDGAPLSGTSDARLLCEAVAQRLASTDEP